MADGISTVEFGCEAMYGFDLTNAQYTGIRNLLCNTYNKNKNKYVRRHVSACGVTLPAPSPACVPRVRAHADRELLELGITSFCKGSSLDLVKSAKKFLPVSTFIDDDGRRWLQVFFDAHGAFKKRRTSVVNGAIRWVDKDPTNNQFTSVVNL
jgi:hypothetical protein